MFQQMSLRYRLLIIPVIAIVIFVVIIGLQVLFGQQVTELGNSIRGFVFRDPGCRRRCSTCRGPSRMPPPRRTPTA